MGMWKLVEDSQRVTFRMSEKRGVLAPNSRGPEFLAQNLCNRLLQSGLKLSTQAQVQEISEQGGGSDIDADSAPVPSANAKAVDGVWLENLCGIVHDRLVEWWLPTAPQWVNDRGWSDPQKFHVACACGQPAEHL